MRRAAIPAVVLAVVAGAWVTTSLVVGDDYELTNPAPLDVSVWALHDDPNLGWSLRYPENWHLQTECSQITAHNQVVVSNVGGDLHHPDVGPSSWTDLWDMRELPRGFVVVELEEPADVPVGPAGSQRSLPLSLDDARPGGRAARYGVPHGLWFPVYLDQHHTYLVRAWFGPEASRHDREIAEHVVASIRFDLG